MHPTSLDRFRVSWTFLRSKMGSSWRTAKSNRQLLFDQDLLHIARTFSIGGRRSTEMKIVNRNLRKLVRRRWRVPPPLRFWTLEDALVRLQTPDQLKARFGSKLLDRLLGRQRLILLQEP
jgi:hypothetical protein